MSKFNKFQNPHDPSKLHVKQGYCDEPQFGNPPGLWRLDAESTVKGELLSPTWVTYRYKGLKTLRGVCGFTIFVTSGMGITSAVLSQYTPQKLFIIWLPFTKRRILLAMPGRMKPCMRTNGAFCCRRDFLQAYPVDANSDERLDGIARHLLSRPPTSLTFPRRS